MIPRRIFAPFFSLVLATVLIIPSSSRASWPHHPAINVPVCAQPNQQLSPVSCPDGIGGAIVAWEDWRDGNVDVYAQHVLAGGGNDSAWPAGGLLVCGLPCENERPRIVSDGAGGAIIAWQDRRSCIQYDIYATRVLASGLTDPAWPSGGRAICTATSDQQAPELAPDGTGGAIVAWHDMRGIGADIYAQHVTASGIVDPAWPTDGRALTTATGMQNFPIVVSDGVGGAIVGWTDYRGGGTTDLYAQHVRSNGTVDPTWTADGRPLCTAPDNQLDLGGMLDGFGGAIFMWSDHRTGAWDIYAQHVMSTGSLAFTFAADGNPVCSTTGDQVVPRFISDGAGGAIVAWQDSRSGAYDIYANHFTPSGGMDSEWPVDGQLVCGASSTQHGPVLATDGAGGAVIAWYDFRNGSSSDVYAHHIRSTGVLDPAWPSNGRAVCLAGLDQAFLTAVPDARNGAIVIWQDGRSGSMDIYSQRVSSFGYLGDPEPAIAGVRDVPNDQGGRVKLSWDASYLDTESPAVVDHYWIFRSVPPNAATETGAPASLAAESMGLLAELHAATTDYWEFVSSQTAYHLTAGYSFLAPTASDSTGAYNPRTKFLVVALNTTGDQYWYSRPDSGYSVDNIAPATPAPFAGNYLAGATHLHWNPNSEADFASYRIYRGNSAGFVPGPANRVASPADTGYADVGDAGGFYKLSAVDVHGNESGFALLTPSSTVDVGPGLPRVLAFARPQPNPASDFALLGYSLPGEARVDLGLFDPSGRLVRTLVRGVEPAGEHSTRWDLKSDSGSRVPAGLYFVRFRADNRTLTWSLVIVR